MDRVETALEKKSEHLPKSAKELAGKFQPSDLLGLADEKSVNQALTELSFDSGIAPYLAKAEWNQETGWHDAQLTSIDDFELSPAAPVLHYSQEIFEGLKAYRHPDGGIYLFRPQFNAARFNQSALRMAMPELPEELFISSLIDLVTHDSRWVPETEGASLYLRPTMVSTGQRLSVSAAKEYRYFCLGSPVGPYFSNDLSPVPVWVTKKYHRAMRGGTGAAKTGGNYAGAMLAGEEAIAHGCAQALFLDAATSTYLEELGGMNLFVVYADGSVATPALTGTILEGGTRWAIIQLLRENGHQVMETTISLPQLIEQIESGEVTEMFACGTAAVVAPFALLRGDDFEVALPEMKLSRSVYQQLTDIQFGLAADEHGWMYRIA
ncbi:hypothetical protein BK816_02945 [Boudabousia tangfeifanii]|uniref:branched-chain-amino-acid transaminase n=1 Tax=Boudabousia tangfeifanii TaxID=1912795 RepID=A0A1D9MJ59_9ACTO|nr:branched-chain amino acid aminotransferase [Boudabousia tangfeifanii]AOZ72381.1 hypothetical protein BK816_02945 [Boudabousia tangfeifanii]